MHSSMSLTRQDPLRTLIMTRSSKDIDHDKITTLKARIRAIKRLDLYDFVQVVKICLILNVVVPK